MADQFMSVGTRSDENVDIVSVSGSDPWTVTLSGAPSSTNIGDALHDEHATPRQYLITGISGSDLTVIDTEGVGSAPDASGTTQAVTNRYYATMTLADADVSNTTFPTASTSGIFEPYNDGDTAYDESVTANGTATNLSSLKYRVPLAERGDGTAGTGARIVRTTSSSIIFDVGSGTSLDYSLVGLEIDGNGQQITGPNGAVRLRMGSSNTGFVQQILLHDCTSSSANPMCGLNGSRGITNLIDCIVYDIESTHTGGRDVSGIKQASLQNDLTLNCTAHNTQNNNGSGDCFGIQTADASASDKVQNCISTDSDQGDTSGSELDYSPASPSTVTMDHNLSSDTTASGTGSLTSRSAANQFVSTTQGSENLHLKSGADAVDTGVDLGTTPSGVQFDIDNRDRDTEGDTWDMGADEFVTAVGGTILPQVATAYYRINA